MNQLSPHHLIFPLHLISTPGHIITAQFVYFLLGLPHFNPLFFLFLLAACGTAFLSMLFAYLHPTLLRQHCFTYHVQLNLSFYLLCIAIHLQFLSLVYVYAYFVVGLLVLAFSCYLGCTIAIA